MNKTKANIKARKEIAKIAERDSLCYCELGAIMASMGHNVCIGTFGLAPAHRHFRRHYSGDWRQLADKREWVIACQACHQTLDSRNKISKEEVEDIFNKLR